MCRSKTSRHWCCHIPGRIDGIDPDDQIVPDTSTPAPDGNAKVSSSKKELKTWSKEIFYHKVASEVLDFSNDRRRDSGGRILTDREKLQIWDSVERHFDSAIEEPYYADLFAFQFDYFRNDGPLRDFNRRVFSVKENQIAGKVG
ncbi:hypothetical protein BGAL_0125g00210 [Botrytis galanthina]|uniref:Uncharacterized protein n=1 Tax=Botrytis galanthina TaxID=278940 RepID=A0A4S8RCB7_9HELO|nr:hypothetical protein BGAL_0125g00210 [Botrytis galanthina]